MLLPHNWSDWPRELLYRAQFVTLEISNNHNIKENHAWGSSEEEWGGRFFSLHWPCAERASWRSLLRIRRKRQSYPREIRAVVGANVGAGENPEGKCFLLMSVRKCGKVFSGTVISQEEMFIGYHVESYPSPWIRICHLSAQGSGSKLWANIWCEV